MKSNNERKDKDILEELWTNLREKSRQTERKDERDKINDEEIVNMINQVVKRVKA
jgi:hypothetical protein